MTQKICTAQFKAVVVPLPFAPAVLWIPGCGIVYKLTPHANGSSWTETILYAFLGSSDGATPLDDRVALDANGNVFGAASGGGDFNFDKTGCAGTLPGGCGVVFEVQQ